MTLLKVPAPNNSSSSRSGTAVLPREGAVGMVTLHSTHGQTGYSPRALAQIWLQTQTNL